LALRNLGIDLRRCYSSGEVRSSDEWSVELHPEPVSELFRVANRTPNAFARRAEQYLLLDAIRAAGHCATSRLLMVIKQDPIKRNLSVAYFMKAQWLAWMRRSYGFLQTHDAAHPTRESEVTFAAKIIRISTPGCLAGCRINPAWQERVRQRARKISAALAWEVIA
jgi:hypothetical protein